MNVTPEQASFLLQYTSPTVKRDHATSRAVIEAMPDSNQDYRPDPHSKTAMELAWHIVAAEHRFYGGIAAGGFDFSPIHRPENVRTPAQIGQWYGESFAKNFEAVSKLSAEGLTKALDFRGLFQWRISILR